METEEKLKVTFCSGSLLVKRVGYVDVGDRKGIKASLDNSLLHGHKHPVDHRVKTCGKNVIQMKPAANKPFFVVVE